MRVDDSRPQRRLASALCHRPTVHRMPWTSPCLCPLCVPLLSRRAEGVPADQLLALRVGGGADAQGRLRAAALTAVLPAQARDQGGLGWVGLTGDTRGRRANRVRRQGMTEALVGSGGVCVSGGSRYRGGAPPSLTPATPAAVAQPQPADRSPVHMALTCGPVGSVSAGLLLRSMEASDFCCASRLPPSSSHQQGCGGLNLVLHAAPPRSNPISNPDPNLVPLG